MESRRIIKWVSVAAVTVSGIDLGLYFGKFAPGQWWTLSADGDDWARFGEYVGGTLGPLFALGAFVGLLVTIELQRRQLIDQRKQLEESRVQSNSKVYLEQARDLWRQAYDIFSEATDHTEYRPEDSPRWSAAASLIRAAAGLEQSIKDPAHLASYRAQRTVTQHLFRGLLRIDMGTFPLEYFRRDPGDHERRMGWPYPPTEYVLVPLYRFGLSAGHDEQLSLEGQFTQEERFDWYTSVFLFNLGRYVTEVRHDNYHP